MIKEFTWNSVTEFGEPQAWYDMPDGTSIEICYEMEGLKPNEYFYSLRQHCSDDDFDNDAYHDTCGIMLVASGPATQMKNLLNMIVENYRKDYPKWNYGA